MDLKNLMSKANSLLKSQKSSKPKDYSLPLNDEDLINSKEQTETVSTEATQKTTKSNNIAIKAVEPVNRNQSLEKLQTGFDELIGQLRGINEHLAHQVAEHEELTSRMNKLPELLESFPSIVENQKQLTENLLEQLQTNAIKNQQFLDAVDSIPNETSKQTHTLVDINNQLEASANTDIQMVDNFNKFNETIDKLNVNSVSQTDSIMQMSKTFATSDRYLKYIISRQNRRFMWMFITSVSVCVIVILTLVGIILYLRQ